MAEAERIKIKYGCAASRMVDDDETIDVPSVGGRPPRSLPRRVLCDIIEPRVEEIFAACRHVIAETGYTDMLASGAIVTGGTTLLDGLPELAEEVLGLPVRRGAPTGIGGLIDVVKSPVLRNRRWLGEARSGPTRGNVRTRTNSGSCHEPWLRSQDRRVVQRSFLGGIDGYLDRVRGRRRTSSTYQGRRCRWQRRQRAQHDDSRRTRRRRVHCGQHRRASAGPQPGAREDPTRSGAHARARGGWQPGCRSQGGARRRAASVRSARRRGHGVRHGRHGRWHGHGRGPDHLAGCAGPGSAHRRRRHEAVPLRGAQALQERRARCSGADRLHRQHHHDSEPAADGARRRRHHDARCLRARR